MLCGRDLGSIHDSDGGAARAQFFFSSYTSHLLKDLVEKKCYRGGPAVDARTGS